MQPAARPEPEPARSALRARAVTEGGLAMLREVQAGLARPAKLLPCKYFYDARGSELFERICELPEYYLTRTELSIVEANAAAMAQAIGSGVRLVEFGSGSSRKTRLLLDRLDAPLSYVPVDLAREQLGEAAQGLRAAYPHLLVEPLCTDYTAPMSLPPAPPGTRRTACYFPGSTVGNFADAEAVRFLQRVRALVGSGGLLLIGTDLRKDTGVLLPAYNDREGVTAEFNRNLLHRVNVELGADFKLADFTHRAIWNGLAGRIEMQLVSRRAQAVTVGAVTFPFREGEVLTTEYSHKYTLPGFAALAAAGGFAVERVWTDARSWFGVQLLRAR